MGGARQVEGHRRTGGIVERVREARVKYEFLRHPKGRVLVRRRKKAPKRSWPVQTLDCLIDDSWVPRWVLRRRLESSGKWETLRAGALRQHVRRYLVSDLQAAPVRWRARPFERLQCSWAGRLAKQPLKGGAGRKVNHDAAQRARRDYVELLREGRRNGLSQLTEEAELGFEHQKSRVSSAEQRANFFLGAAGLTTTLVLANAGLLFGDNKLEAPWLQLAAVALVIASVCAIVAGLRALQATMITFDRSPPSSVAQILERRRIEADRLARAYLAALLVAQNRTSTIGEWKVGRLRAARRWFVAATASVLLLTGFVLVEALW